MALEPSMEHPNATTRPTGPNPPLWGGSPPSPLGDHDAYQAVGTTASPLLAGFSITLVVAVLRDAETFRYPDAALIAFTAAAGLLLVSLQTIFFVRRYHWTRVDLEAWFDQPMDPKFEAAYRQMHARDAMDRERWRMRTHLAYNLGLLSFLFGTATLLAPPHDSNIGGARWVATSLAGILCLVELSWWATAIIRNQVGSET